MKMIEFTDFHNSKISVPVHKILSVKKPGSSMHDNGGLLLEGGHWYSFLDQYTAERILSEMKKAELDDSV